MIKRDNIVALPGLAIPTNEPVPEIIEMLQGALEDALAGRTVGLALIRVNKDPMQSKSNFYAQEGGTPLLIAATWGVMHSFGEHMSSSED